MMNGYCTEAKANGKVVFDGINDYLPIESLEQQCKCYEEEIKSLKEEISTLKLIIQGITRYFA